jgi:hypothetical protein
MTSSATWRHRCYDAEKRAEIAEADYQRLYCDTRFEVENFLALEKENERLREALAIARKALGSAIGPGTNKANRVVIAALKDSMRGEKVA